MNTNLLPLRIPSGWAVTYNVYLADVPMEVRDGAIVNFEYYKEDLLQIRHLKLVDGCHRIDDSSWLLDVGWYPDSDPDGEYLLQVLRGDFRDGDPVITFRSRSIQELRAAIERVLGGLSRGEPIVAVQRALPR